MPGGGRCPDCGSTELVEDSHYSQSQLVCSDCGCVVTEGVLTTTYSDEGNLRGTCGSLSRVWVQPRAGEGLTSDSSHLPPSSGQVQPLKTGEKDLKWTGDLQKVRDCHSSVFLARSMVSGMCSRHNKP